MPPPDTILHIGAGLCSELDIWRETGASRIVLLEPNPELLPELRRRTQGINEVEIFPAAIAGDVGRESLYLFNFPLLASLREPTGLRSMLPGLQQTGRAMVETRRLATLVDELQLDSDGRHRLIIDAPGMETELIDQFIADDLASTFTAVEITAGREPWYQGSQPLQALIERLEQAGYEPGAVATGNDPDWPRATFRYSRHAAENKRLAEELERLQEHLRSQNEEFSRRFAELSQERDEANAKLESEQKSARAAAAENEKIQGRNKELSDELKNLKDAADEAQEQIDAIRAERDELKAGQEKLGHDYADLKKARDELQTKLECEQKNTRSAAEENEKLQKQNKDLADELEQANEREEKLSKHIDALEPLQTKYQEAEQQLDQVTQARDNLKQQMLKHNKEAHKLKIRVSQLEEENDDYKERHMLLEEELIKAEAQIELIKQMFLSGDDALEWDDEPENP